MKVIVKPGLLDDKTLVLNCCDLKHHRLNGHGFGWTLGVGDGQGGLVCCGSWGHKELDTTERLNWTDGFCGGSAGKESACNAGNPGSIPGLERSTGEGIGYPLQCSWASLVTQLVKNPPAMCETWVWSLGWEDPLEKGKRLPTPVFWPGQFHGLYSPWDCKDTQLSNFH